MMIAEQVIHLPPAMAHLLQYAFEKASVLPDELQDDIAQQLIEELEWELHWDNTLEQSQALLEDLASKALQEYRNGNSVEMGFDERGMV